MQSLYFLNTVGSGAFGTVYLAELSMGQGIRRNIAVKVLMCENAGHKQFISRLRDEARLLGLLQGDSIIQVLGLVKIKGMDSILMEFVEGVDLDSILKKHKVLQPRTAAELIATAADGLSKAHLATHPRTGQPLGVVHRDIKPANLMLTISGNLKICDFGVAQASFAARESITNAEDGLGTLKYMDPFYYKSGKLTPQMDVYGLGLILLEMIIGRQFGNPPQEQE